jgi:hypothetical protein
MRRLGISHLRTRTSEIIRTGHALTPRPEAVIGGLILL